MKAYGFIGNLTAKFLEPSRRKRASMQMLKTFWLNQDATLISKEDRREITFKDTGSTLTIRRIRGFGWTSLPVLPFALLHESLHFIVAYFTGRTNLIVGIPPMLDLISYPLWIVYIASRHVTVTPFQLGLTLWFAWSWALLLRGNLQGDFTTLLLSAQNKQGQKPCQS